MLLSCFRENMPDNTPRDLRFVYQWLSSELLKRDRWRISICSRMDGWLGRLHSRHKFNLCRFPWEEWREKEERKQATFTELCKNSSAKFWEPPSKCATARPYNALWRMFQPAMPEIWQEYFTLPPISEISSERFGLFRALCCASLPFWLGSKSHLDHFHRPSRKRFLI